MLPCWLSPPTQQWCGTDTPLPGILFSPRSPPFRRVLPWGVAVGPCLVRPPPPPPLTPPRARDLCQQGDKMPGASPQSSDTGGWGRSQTGGIITTAS